MPAVTDRPKRKPRTAAKQVKPVRFDSIHDMCTATNEEHVKILLGELPWMRAGLAVLNMNDRELEAKVYACSGDDEAQHSWLDLVEALTGIRNRYQAGIDICNAASARIMHIFERLQAEAEATR